MRKVCCQLSPFFTRTSTGDPYTNQVQICLKKRKSSRDLENERIRILLERQKEQILAEVRTEIQKHELQADSDTRGIQEFLDSQRMEIDHTITGVSNPGEINYYFKKNYQNKIGILVKLVSKVFMRWKN